MSLQLPFIRPSRIAFCRAVVALIIWNLAGPGVLVAQDSSVVPVPDPSRSGRPLLADSSGADLAVIFPDSLPDMPRTMSELLAARVPGVFVQRSTGAAGASSWISIRDAGAVEGLEPLVIVDGVTRVSTFTTYSIWDAEPVRLAGERLPPSPIDDIPADEVERVEILRGPAAAARYGRDARYGVILVTTRRPTPGRPRIRASITGGFADEQARFPANFAHVTATGAACSNPSAAGGYCTQTGTSTYTVLRDRNPFQPGARRGARLDGSGGVGSANLSFGVSHDRAAGVLPMDGTDRTAATARMSLPFGQRVRLSLSAQTSLRGVTQPAQGSSGLEVITGGVFALPVDCSSATPCTVDCAQATPCPANTTTHGYRYGTPDYLATLGTSHRVQHFSEGAMLEIDAASWLSTHTSLALDGMGDHGKRADGPVPDNPYSATSRRDIVSRATRSTLAEQFRARWLLGAANATTTLAVSADRARFQESDAAYAYASTSGGQVTSSRATSFQSTSERRTTIRLEQRLTTGERISAGAGAVWSRTRLLLTPSRLRPTLDGFADASVRLIDPANAPRGLRSLRLRTALGQVSGYDPRSLSRTANLLFLSSPYGAPQTGSRVLPERAVELEGGIDGEFSPAHLRLSLTAYRRSDTEPYMLTFIPQPNGRLYGVTDMRRRVRGLEISAGATLVDADRLRWTAESQVGLTGDRVTHWAPTFTPIGGFANPLIVLSDGKPFGSWLTRPPVWNDANGDGIIGFGELSFPGDIVPLRERPVGAHSRPTRTAALQNSITVLRALTIGAQLDYSGGHEVLNGAAAAQCRAQTCAAINDRSASFADQARGLSAYTVSSVSGYLESGATVRLRELSATIGSARMATLAHAGSLTFTLAARNLATWSRYRGPDSEIDLLAPSQPLLQFGGFPGLYLPNTRQFTARLTLGY